MGVDGRRHDSARIGRRSIGALVCALVAIGLVAVPSGATARASGGAANCRPYGDTPCLLPFPNDLYTKRDKHSKTGVGVHLPQAAMPTNQAGSQINTAPYDRNDGFSPGSTIIARVPGLDTQQALERTKPAPLTDMSQAFRKRAPIVLVDEQTKERQLVWAELDANADGPQNTTLLIHPGENLEYGHTYAVAMRNLKDSSGDTLKAPAWFRKFRDGGRLPRDQRSDGKRYEHIFKVLKKSGVGRNNLYMAWDFTVGSAKSLTRTLLHIRNASFRTLGDKNLADGKIAGHAPTFHVDSVQTNPDPGIARYITGTFKVPCWLNQDGCPPGRPSITSRATAMPTPSARPATARRRPSTASSRRSPRRAIRHEAPCTATGSWDPAARSQATPRRTWPANTTSSSARPIGGDWPTATSPTTSPPWRT
jgi:hypothetical protein